MREQMILDEKLIGVELTAGKKQFKWPVNDTDKKPKENDEDDTESNDEMSALQKILVVHSAVLGVGAKVDQRNLVQLTIKDTAGDKIILDQPILSLSLNKNDSISAFNLRVVLNDTIEVTFKLLEGDGPVHLITSRILEPPFDFGGYSSDDDDDDQSDTMSVTSDEDLPRNAGDRKGQTVAIGKLSKKAKKLQVPSTTNSRTNNTESSELQQQKKKRKKDD